MTPGVYEGVSFKDYCAIDAVNHSALKQFRRSPSHVRAAIKGEAWKDSPTKRLGTALHAWALERGRFDSLVAIDPEFKGEGQKKKYEAWEAENAGKTVITKAQHDKVLAMSRKISAHPVARKLAAAKGRGEVCLVWIDPATGVRCKARADKLIDPPAPGAKHVGIDIKSTKCADLDAFAYSIMEYGYDTGTVFYERGARVLGIGEVEFLHVIVENEPPHEVIVGRVSDDDLEVARQTIDRWLHHYAECARDDRWPGYSDQLEVIGIPAWALKRRRLEEGENTEGEDE